MIEPMKTNPILKMSLFYEYTLSQQFWDELLLRVYS